MAKAFFRFLRGELNGYYITRLNNTLNITTEDIKTFLAKFKAQQFNVGEIDAEYAYNLGRFAGVAFRRTSRTDSAISIRMTDSHTLNGQEVSDRGLFDTANERFDFSDADYEGDINDKATPIKRSTLVGDAELIGYISDKEEDVFNDDGTVKESAILSVPPTDTKAYSDFYGDDFLMLAEGISSFESVNIGLYIELVKVMQIIRYNGESIDSLSKLIKLICSDNLIQIERIETVDVNHINVYYVYNENVEIDYKQQRLSLLDYVIETKFPQANFVEL